MSFDSPPLADTAKLGDLVEVVPVEGPASPPSPTSISPTLSAAAVSPLPSQSPSSSTAHMRRHSSFLFLPSITLRAKSILFFVFLVLLATTAIVVATGLTVSVAFEKVEARVSNENVDRVASLLNVELAKLTRMLEDYAIWDVTAEALVYLRDTGNTSLLDSFIVDSFYTDGSTYNTYSELNFIAVWDADGRNVFATYHPDVDGTVSVDPGEVPTEVLNASFVRSMAGGEYAGILNLEGIPPMLVGLMGIRASEEDPVVGYLAFASDLSKGTSSIATVVQGCIVVWSAAQDLDSMPVDARAAFEQLSPTAESDPKAWGETKTRSAADRKDELPNRVCPESYTEDVRNLDAGYLLIRDPVASHPPGPLLRIDHRRDVITSGSIALAIIVVVVVIALALFSVVTSKWLDRKVLRKLKNVSSFLVESAAEADDGTTGADAAASKQSDLTASLPGQSKPKFAPVDEISRLERLLRARLDHVTADLEAAILAHDVESRAAERLESSLEQLNMLCDRSGDTRPPDDGSHMLEEPLWAPVVVDLEGLLENAFAVEFLKAFCRHDSTANYLFYLLDFAQLRSGISTASSSEQQHAALAFYRRFLHTGSPLELRIGSKMHKKLAKALDTSKTGSIVAAFEDVAAEVAELFKVDVLPRFEITQEYSEMVHVLRTDFGGDLKGPHVELQAFKTPPAPNRAHRGSSTSANEEEPTQSQQQQAKRERRKSGMFSGLFRRNGKAVELFSDTASVPSSSPSPHMSSPLASSPSPDHVPMVSPRGRKATTAGIPVSPLALTLQTPCIDDSSSNGSVSPAPTLSPRFVLDSKQVEMADLQKSPESEVIAEADCDNSSVESFSGRRK